MTPPAPISAEPVLMPKDIAVIRMYVESGANIANLTARDLLAALDAATTERDAATRRAEEAEARVPRANESIVHNSRIAEIGQRATAAEAEAARLREALEKIAALRDSPYEIKWEDDVAAALQIADTALAAGNAPIEAPTPAPAPAPSEEAMMVGGIIASAVGLMIGEAMHKKDRKVSVETYLMVERDIAIALDRLAGGAKS